MVLTSHALGLAIAAFCGNALFRIEWVCTCEPVLPGLLSPQERYQSCEFESLSQPAVFPRHESRLNRSSPYPPSRIRFEIDCIGSNSHGTPGCVSVRIQVLGSARRIEAIASDIASTRLQIAKFLEDATRELQVALIIAE